MSMVPAGLSKKSSDALCREQASDVHQQSCQQLLLMCQRIRDKAQGYNTNGIANIAFYKFVVGTAAWCDAMQYSGDWIQMLT